MTYIFKAIRALELAFIFAVTAAALAACGGGGGDDTAPPTSPTSPTLSDGVVIAPGSGIVSASLGDALHRIYVVPGETTERGISMVQSAPPVAQFDVSVTAGAAFLASSERGGRHFVQVDSRSMTAGSTHPYRIVIRNRANGATAEITGQVLVLTPQVIATASIGAAGGTIATQNGGRLEFDPQPSALPLGVTVSVADAPSGARWVRVKFDRDVSRDTRLVRFVQPASSPTGTGRAGPLAANGRSRIASYPTLAWNWGRAYYQDGSNFRIPEGIALALLSTKSCFGLIGQICITEQLAWELTAPSEEGYRIAADRNAVPVLFVHGFQPDGAGFSGISENGGTDYWGSFPQRLQELDGRVVPFEFRWYTNARFEDVADELASAISLIHTRTGGRRVTIVAHSFGGILARTMLQGLGTLRVDVSDKVEQLITIGTPHSGIADAATTLGDVLLPDGQDSAVFKGCGQISCHQMGEWVWDVDLYANLLGVDALAGSLPAKLARTLSDFKPEVRLAVGIGLALDGVVGGTGYRYRDGDALISWSGQRLRPSDGVRGPADPQYLACEGSGLSGKKEILLGASDGREPNKSLASSDYSASKQGYGHSSGSLIGTLDVVSLNLLQTDLRCSTASGCTHASFELVKDALVNGICRTPIITAQSPRLVSVEVGSAVSLTASAVSAGPLGGGTLKYQWLRSPDMFTAPSAIVSATGPTFTIPSAATTDNGWVYWVWVTGPDGNVTTSQAMELRVEAPPASASCAMQQVSWTQGASTCNATYGGGASGTSSPLSDTTAPTTGTATAVCTNGVLGVSSPNCTTALPPPSLMVAPTPLAPSGTITSLTPVFSWSGGSGAANYEINVRDLATNTIALRVQGIGTTSTNFAAPAGFLANGRQYRWDISACPNFACSSGYVTSSELTFLTQVPSPPPTLVSPTPLSPTGTITTLTPVFTWNGGSGAANYEINVRDLTTNTIVLRVQGIGTSSTTFATPAGVLINGRQYRWDITACPDFTCSSGYVTSGDLTFVAQLPSPPLAVPDLIAQGVVFEPGTVTVGGMTLVTFSITNTGTATSSASQAAVRITPAAATDSGSTNVGSVAIPALPAGSSVVRTLGVNVPTAVGAYKVWVVADSNGAAGQSASAKANDASAAALAITAVSRVTPLGATAEGAYSGTMTGGPNPNFRMVVLEDGEFWSLYGVNAGGQFFVNGFTQGRASAGGGSFSASDVRDFGFFPAVTGGTVSGTFDAAVGTLQGTVRFPGLTVNVTGGPLRDVAYEYDQPVSLTGFVGNWSLDSNTGDRISLIVSATGAMTATSALGCSFTGTVAPRPSGKNVLNVSLQFGASPCLLPGQRMTGVAVAHRLQDGRTQLTFAGVNAARTAGLMAFGTR